ncbi:MAG: septum formation initiator family protein [Acidimicrobiales bacterium]
MPDAGPALRLVGPSSRSRRFLTRAVTAAAASLAAAGLFAVVALHVFLSSGQADLDRLQARVDAETTRNGRLTVEVAELDSPARVSSIARDRLGMVPPSTVVYLPAADLASALPPVPDGPAPRPGPPVAAVLKPAPTAPASPTTKTTTSPSTTVAGRTTTTVGRARVTSPPTTSPPTRQAAAHQ